MAKQIQIKEQDTTINMGDLDLTYEETRVEVPTKPTESVFQRKAQINTDKTVVPSCLQNKKIIVRFLPRPTVLVNNSKHVLYGGLAENAFREYVVPRLASNGSFVNVLTNDEKTYLEEVMQLEPNALSIHRKEDNYWKDVKVRLGRQDTILDLSIPVDYIKYKVLKANSDFIASSLEELEEKPKVTYQFVMISEADENKTGLKKLSYSMQAYMLLGQLKEDEYTLRVIVEILEGRPVSKNTTSEILLAKINDYISTDTKQTKTFLSIAEDKLLSTKVLIRKAVENGLISKRGTFYYLTKENLPLCENNEDPTLNTAAKYLNLPKHQEIKLMLEAKTNN